MTILFYNGKKDPLGEELLETFRNVISAGGLRISDSLAEIRERIKRPGAGIRLFIFYVHCEEELLCLLELSGLLSDRRIVLLLSEGLRDRILDAHRLKPRQVMVLNPVSLSDIKAILTKTLARECRFNIKDPAERDDGGAEGAPVLRKHRNP